MSTKTKTQLPWQQPGVIRHSQLLYNSFQHWTCQTLIDAPNDQLLGLAEMLFNAPFVLVSHGTEADPIFNYGNRKALELWHMTWEEFTSLPSRCSAEPVEQSERSTLLSQVSHQGLITNFRGIRISRTGERFLIENGIIWNVLDEEHHLCGQAATYGNPLL
ncbi:MAG: MEKHLA domain-containing protein [Chamaesiphon sp.]